MNRLPLSQRLALPWFLGVKALLSPVALGAFALAEDKDGRILLARHSYASGWSLPGGGVGRGEPPIEAVVREVREEVGLLRGDAPEFFGLYTRKSGWATNVNVLYRMRNVEIDFKPNLEIREVRFVDPKSPPAGTAVGTVRRLAELTGGGPRSLYW